jgi:hypothetical protein
MADIDYLHVPPRLELTWLHEQMAAIAAMLPAVSYPLYTTRVYSLRYQLETKQICNLSASCIAEDLEYFRPGVGYTIIYPRTLRELLAVPARKNFRIRIDFVDGVQWFLIVRCFVPAPVFEDKWEQKGYEANPPPLPRFGVMSEVLSLQAMRTGGVTLVPNAYLPKEEAVMTPGPYMSNREMYLGADPPRLSDCPLLLRGHARSPGQPLPRLFRRCSRGRTR